MNRRSPEARPAQPDSEAGGLYSSLFVSRAQPAASSALSRPAAQLPVPCPLEIRGGGTRLQ